MENESADTTVDAAVTTSVDDRLRAVKAARAKLAEERAARLEDARKLAQLEAEEQALRDDPEIAALEDEHGPAGTPDSKIAVFRTVLGAIVVKRPNHLIYKRFQNAKSNSTEEVEKLVRPSVLYPSKARFDEILEEQPGVLTNIADLVCHLAGIRTEALTGKS